MAYKSILILLVLGAAIFSGCVEDKNPKKYTYENDSRGYFILYPDGKFVEFYSDGTSTSGSYRIENDELIQIYEPFGIVTKMRKDGDSFVTEKGGRYVKTKT